MSQILTQSSQSCNLIIRKYSDFSSEDWNSHIRRSQYRVYRARSQARASGIELPKSKRVGLQHKLRILNLVSLIWVLTNHGKRDFITTYEKLASYYDNDQWDRPKPSTMYDRLVCALKNLHYDGTPSLKKSKTTRGIRLTIKDAIAYEVIMNNLKEELRDLTPFEWGDYDKMRVRSKERRSDQQKTPDVLITVINKINIPFGESFSVDKFFRSEESTMERKNQKINLYGEEVDRWDEDGHTSWEAKYVVKDVATPPEYKEAANTEMANPKYEQAWEPYRKDHAHMVLYRQAAEELAARIFMLAQHEKDLNKSKLRGIAKYCVLDYLWKIAHHGYNTLPGEAAPILMSADALFPFCNEIQEIKEQNLAKLNRIRLKDEKPKEAPPDLQYLLPPEPVYQNKTLREFPNLPKSPYERPTSHGKSPKDYFDDARKMTGTSDYDPDSGKIYIPHGFPKHEPIFTPEELLKREKGAQEIAKIKSMLKSTAH